MRRFVWPAMVGLTGAILLGCGKDATPPNAQGPSQAKVEVSSANEVVLNVPGMT
jgi:hypothetical protein